MRTHQHPHFVNIFLCFLLSKAFQNVVCFLWKTFVLSSVGRTFSPNFWCVLIWFSYNFTYILNTISFKIPLFHVHNTWLIHTLIQKYLRVHSYSVKVIYLVSCYHHVSSITSRVMCQLNTFLSQCHTHYTLMSKRKMVWFCEANLFINKL